MLSAILAGVLCVRQLAVKFTSRNVTLWIKNSLPLVVAVSIATVVAISAGLFSTPQSRKTMSRSFDPFRPETIELAAISDIEDYQFIDARYSQDFDRGHIVGAISTPLNSGKARLLKTIEQIDRDRKLIVYCHSASCEFDRVLAKRLHIAGVESIYLMEEGFREWEANGLPIEK